MAVATGKSRRPSVEHSPYDAYTQVTDSRGKRVRNLFTRNGQFYFRGVVDGKRRSRSCPYTVRSQAIQWARRQKQAIRDPEAIELPQVRRKRSPCVKLGTIIELYRQAADVRHGMIGRPLEKTVTSNIAIFRRLVSLGTECDEKAIDELGADVLTPKLVEQYVKALRAKRGKLDEIQERRLRVTIGSTLRQAKSIFAGWAVEYYAREVELPSNVDEFKRSGRGEGGKRAKYRLPPQELIDATMNGAEELREKKSNLFPVFVLCYDMGLRAGEACNASWDWIETRRNGDGEEVYEILICARPHWKGSKNLVDHKIPISRKTWEQLHETRVEGQVYILPKETRTGRDNLIKYEFAAWMRAIGWDRQTYPKAAHELRKLAGSMWYTHRGIQYAAAWLGDSAETVLYYYSDLMTQAKAVEMR